MSKLRQKKIRSLTAKFSPGHRIESHSHNWLQLVYATSGVMRLCTKRSTWIIPSQRAVWIPPNLEHQVGMSGAVMMRTLYFHPAMSVFVSNECRAVNVSNLMRELIIHTCDLGIVTTSSTEHRNLIEFVVFQAKRMIAEPLMLPMPGDVRALQAARSILMSPARALVEVADENSTSLRTLQRLFSEETGLSLGRWRSQARLLSALPMLEEGRQVTEVSLDLGFESLSAFISAFRKFFGVTPARYFQRPPNH